MDYDNTNLYLKFKDKYKGAKEYFDTELKKELTDELIKKGLEIKKIQYFDILYYNNMINKQLWKTANEIMQVFFTERQIDLLDKYFRVDYLQSTFFYENEVEDEYYNIATYADTYNDNITLGECIYVMDYYKEPLFLDQTTRIFSFKHINTKTLEITECKLNEIEFMERKTIENIINNF